MIQVTMGEQNFIQPSKTQAGAQQLALRAFAAIDHEAVFVRQHQCRRQPALHRGRRSRCSQKNHLKHRRSAFPDLRSLSSLLKAKGVAKLMKRRCGVHLVWKRSGGVKRERKADVVGGGSAPLLSKHAQRAFEQRRRLDIQWKVRLHQCDGDQTCRCANPTGADASRL